MSYIWQEKVKATVVGSLGFELEVMLPDKQMLVHVYGLIATSNVKQRG